MIVCDPCPYRGRCENMGRCIRGKNPPIYGTAGAEFVATSRPPKTVATTFGHTETAAKINVPKKSTGKGAKKKARKVTMQ